MEQTYMKEQPILNLLLKMSLPMVVSMLVNSLYNIVDSFFVAKISENAMTAHRKWFFDTEFFHLLLPFLCSTARRNSSSLFGGNGFLTFLLYTQGARFQ